MNESTCKVVKLTNGEDIVCEIGDGNSENECAIGRPLKIEVHSRSTKNGIIESLNLTRWIGPYTEQSFFLIKTSHILLITEASHGLSRYYDHVLKELDDWDNSKSKKRQLLDDMDDEMEDDMGDELLEEIKIPNKTIH